MSVTKMKKMLKRNKTTISPNRVNFRRIFESLPRLVHCCDNSTAVVSKILSGSMRYGDNIKRFKLILPCTSCSCHPLFSANHPHLHSPGVFGLILHFKHLKMLFRVFRNRFGRKHIPSVLMMKFHSTSLTFSANISPNLKTLETNDTKRKFLDYSMYLVFFDLSSSTPCYTNSKTFYFAVQRTVI